MWGFDLPTPPCQALATEFWDYRDWPPTCECLAECQATNLRVVYVTQCVNASDQKPYTASVEGWPPKVVNAEVRYPMRDPFGDGKWLRQAYIPHRRDPPVSDAELASQNLALAARLDADGQASQAKRLCSGRGILTEPMPWFGPRQHNGKVCHCLPGWYGDQCEYGPGHLAAPVEKQYCVHKCSGRGVCKLNYCHCVPGTWGVDCSFGDVDAALAVRVKAQQEEHGHSAPIGWTQEMLSTPPPGVPGGFGRVRELKIYVYDVPPKFHVWMAAHFRRAGRWDQSYLYSLDAKV